jgi:tmRNA-binding protein
MKEGNRFNHEERRTRKLLLHKNEIKKLSEETNKMGLHFNSFRNVFKKTIKLKC